MTQPDPTQQFDEAGKPIPQPDGVHTDDVLTPEAEELQKAEDKAVAEGVRGVKVDPTPEENYSFAGQLKGLPTPETDPDQAAKAGSTKFR